MKKQEIDLTYLALVLLFMFLLNLLFNNMDWVTPTKSVMCLRETIEETPTETIVSHEPIEGLQTSPPGSDGYALIDFEKGLKASGFDLSLNQPLLYVHKDDCKELK